MPVLYDNEIILQSIKPRLKMANERGLYNVQRQLIPLFGSSHSKSPSPPESPLCPGHIREQLVDWLQHYRFLATRTVSNPKLEQRSKRQTENIIDVNSENCTLYFTWAQIHKKWVNTVVHEEWPTEHQHLLPKMHFSHFFLELTEHIRKTRSSQQL